jgi:hypothetical protein
VLIINHNIEKTVLVQTRAEGDAITGRGFPQNVSAVFTPECRSMGSRGGGYAVTSLRPYHGHPLIVVDRDEFIKYDNNSSEAIITRAKRELFSIMKRKKNRKKKNSARQ